jgi:type II secretory pathway pseudopilin PulG
MMPHLCPNTCSSRNGFSLLEVLVACGILVVGLASIAAILPAAGARLGEAAAQDRAAAAAYVAFSEIGSRGLCRRELFPGASSATATAIVFGETLSLSISTACTASGYLIGTAAPVTANGAVTAGLGVISGTLQAGATPVLTAPLATAIASRISNVTDPAIDNRRGYFPEDEVRYGPSLTGVGPANLFSDGMRSFNRGVCWGAILTPMPFGITTGSMNAVKASVAVFRKPGNAVALSLVSLTSGPAASSGIFITGNNTPTSLQRSLLKPCSSLLAIPPAATATSTGPQWLPIRSSWILTGTITGTSGSVNGTTVSGTYVGAMGSTISGALVSSAVAPTCVTFAGEIPSPLLSGTPATLTVIAFENLLLVQEQTLSVK